MTVAIIDYGVGNLRSVEKAFTSQGIDAVVSDDEKVLREAERLVLPGVGAFAACMDGLRGRGFDELVCEAAAAGKPIIGLCVDSAVKTPAIVCLITVNNADGT